MQLINHNFLAQSERGNPAIANDLGSLVELGIHIILGQLIGQILI